MALSNDVRNMVKDIEASSSTGRKFASSVMMALMGELISWIESNDTLIQWDGAEGLNGATASTLAPAASELSADVDLVVTSAANVENPFRQNASCTVTLTGTAPDKTINGVAGPLEVALVDGRATVTLAASDVGTIIATMSAGDPAQLSATDVLTVTLS